MTKHRPLFCLAAVLLFPIALLAQSLDPLFRHIPPDAAQVYHINFSALGSKITWDEISGLIPPPKNNNQSGEDLMKYVKDPSLSGVDFQKGVIVASGHLANNTDSPSVFTVLIQLSDSGKLMSLVRNGTKGLRNFKFPGKIQVAGKDKFAIACTDKFAVITFISAKTKPAQTEQGTKPVVSPSYTLTAAKKSVAALEGFASSPYTTDTTFTRGFSDDADFHIWSESGSFLQQLMELTKNKNPMGANMKIPASKTHLRTLTAFRFDQGKITLHTTLNLPPDSLRIAYAMLNSRPLNADLVTHIPGKGIIGMLNMHFAPSALTYMLNHYHLKQMIDSMLAKSGLTMDDCVRAFKGDFLAAAVSPDQLPDTGKIKPQIYFVATVGDMNAFMKVAGKMGLNKDSAGGKMEKMKTGFTLRDNILVVGPKGKTDRFFATNNSGNLHLVTDLVTRNPFSVVVDVKEVQGFMKSSDSAPSPKTQQALHFLSALDRLTWAGGSYQNGQTEYYFELKMTNESENSLRSLLKLLH
jgi:hypothetical protein